MNYLYVVALDQRAIVNQRVYVKVMASNEEDAKERALEGESATAVAKIIHDGTEEVLSGKAYVLSPDSPDWDDIPEWK